MELKVVINDAKEKKSYAKKLEDNPFIGRKLGDKISGNELGLDGYELEITGGSDISGCPMRKDLPGTAKKKCLLSGGVGIHLNRKGMRKRKSVSGNTIHEKTSQLNLKVAKYGSKSLVEALGVQPKEEKAEEKKK